jgi:hypothetical protein
LVNSYLGLFTAAPRGGRLLSLTCEAILQSSLTTVRSLALVYSTRPRVSVLGTGRPRICHAAFPGTPPRRYVLASRLSSRSGGLDGGVLPLPACRHAPQSEGGTPFRDPSPLRSSAGRRNLDLLCIGCASRPPLSPRLTPGGRTLPGRPQSFGGRDTLPSSLLTPAFSLASGPPVLTVRLRPRGDAPLPKAPVRAPFREFGTTLSPGKFSARKRLTSELLRIL